MVVLIEGLWVWHRYRLLPRLLIPVTTYFCPCQSFTPNQFSRHAVFYRCKTTVAKCGKRFDCLPDALYAVYQYYSDLLPACLFLSLNSTFLETRDRHPKRKHSRSACVPFEEVAMSIIVAFVLLDIRLYYIFMIVLNLIIFILSIVIVINSFESYLLSSFPHFAPAPSWNAIFFLIKNKIKTGSGCESDHGQRLRGGGHPAV